MADSPAQIAGLLVTHGALGTELIRVVESILGPQEDIAVVSNTGTSMESLTRKIRTQIESIQAEDLFIFVDLLGGSCSQVCQLVRQEHPSTVIFSGVNLPMLLEFAYKRRLLEPVELAAEVARKGREGIQCLSLPHSC
ncbi:MAG: hypothetical protein KJ970_02800 [Candidatus Eisenbacteria bacterium]|uniref:PTS EIIA type-4 domain-containing protein n=1 Tax=Eiseniibacteriota bacterium TaxID=2212470 RepID=A0A948W4Y1_UNCEI|nr:hypothetical protein [Candidatus Eisenbacteria bacterium]MBU1948974.1 hypothetical protein [Candidatus Eisenbacteria bacterium]MBU2689829.1 hypothetical protein [Candidatus Eisenbacteria bacterium]